MIWFRPGATERSDDGRPTVWLGTVEAVCDTEDEALALVDQISQRD